MADQASVRLTGWPAVVVGVGIVAWTGWGFARHLQPVPAAAREAVQAWLVEDYNAGPRFPPHSLGFAHEERVPDAGGAMLVQGGAPILNGNPPTFRDSAEVFLQAVDAHGWSDFRIARAAIAVRKPDQTILRPQRFLALQSQPGGRWKVAGESTAWDYWSALVPAPRNRSSWP